MQLGKCLRTFTYALLQSPTNFKSFGWMKKRDNLHRLPVEDHSDKTDENQTPSSQENVGSTRATGISRTQKNSFSWKSMKKDGKFTLSTYAASICCYYRSTLFTVMHNKED